jgi:hypothetical protein
VTRGLVLLVQTLGVYTSAALAATSLVLEVGQSSTPGLVLAEFGNLSELNGGNEALGVPRGVDLCIEFIDLLERETLGLVDAEVYEGHADAAESAPDCRRLVTML